MPLRDLLRKKPEEQRDNRYASATTTSSPAAPSGQQQQQQEQQQQQQEQQQQQQQQPAPITFLRTTTNTAEEIQPPGYSGDETPSIPQATPKHHNMFRRHSPSPNASSGHSRSSSPPRHDRSLADRFHIGRSRSATSSSINIPADLPDIEGAAARGEEQEAQWEKRATLLAKSNSTSESQSRAGRSRSGSVGISDAAGDENIQEAIRLHESGDLARSTKMFGKLANPNGANNALSQVLYGLALRHGWGCAKNEQLAVEYLSLAASNSAEIESLALNSGIKKGGAAKGELSLAIFELANCFRNAWGVKKDPVAAKQYYEVAANMGDTDAMNEVAWCYLEGFGCKKDKFKAAQYLRLAEEKGCKTVGNTWIWKDKYGGPKKV